ncbi:hypothetical protein GCM10027088_45830 [Nocardia goodfellowii]
MAATLQTTPARIDPAANLIDLGLDSLMGTELKVTLHRAFGRETPTIELLSAGNIHGLAALLSRILRDG